MPAYDRERHRHPDPPFAIDLPAGAEQVKDTPALLVALEPLPRQLRPFRTSLTVTVESPPPELAHDEYCEQSLEAESEALPGWRLIDREDTTLGDMPALRTLATYLGSAYPGVDLGRDFSVAVEQWRLLHNGRGWVVSASYEAPEYHLVADLWRACAESLRLHERA